MEFLGVVNFGNPSTKTEGEVPKVEQKQAAPAAPAAEWEQINASTRAAQPARDLGRLETLQAELASASSPDDIATLKREISRAEKALRAPGATRKNDMVSAALENADAKRARKGASDNGLHELPQLNPNMVWGNPEQTITEDAPVVAPEQSAILRRAADYGLTAVKGAIGVPEAVVGLADIATGGEAGKFLEELGFQPKVAKEILDNLYSPEQKAANARVQDATGFVDTAAAMVQNPSTIAHGIVESAPMMAGGGVVARGVMKALPAVAPVAAGAVGEGVVGAGSAAEHIRQQTADGKLTGKQSGAALASGVGTGLLGFVGGKIAQRLGVADIDTVIAGGTTQATAKGFARRLVEGGIAEGVFEELPQSVQEQMWNNFALDKPITEGVGKAGAAGLVVGAAQGGGTAAMFNKQGQAAPAPATNPLFSTPGATPAAPAPAAAAGMPGAPVAQPAEAEQAPGSATSGALPEAPPAYPDALTPEQAAIVASNGNAGTLAADEAAQPAAPGANSNTAVLDSNTAVLPETKTIKATAGQIAGMGRKRALELMAIEDRSAEQEAEYEFLTKNVGNVDTIAKAYGIVPVNAIASATGSTARAAFKEAKTADYEDLNGVEVEHNRAVDHLNSVSPQANFTPFRESTRNSDDHRVARDEARTLAQFFGKKLFFFDHKASGKDDFQIEGATLSASTMLMDAKTSKPARVVMGHELTHAMRKDAPGLYDWMASQIVPKADVDRFIADFKATHGDTAAQGMTDDKITEELLANTVGARFGEDAFWQELARRDPAKFQTVAQRVMQFIDGLISKITGSDDKYLKDAAADLAAIRDIVATTMEEYVAILDGITPDLLTAHDLKAQDAADVATLAQAFIADEPAMEQAAEQFANDEPALLEAAQEIINHDQDTKPVDAGAQGSEDAPAKPAETKITESKDSGSDAERENQPEREGRAEPAAEVAPAPAAEDDKPKYETDLPLVEHVTKGGKGKTLTGVVAPISLDEAKKFDLFAFKKDGGVFIRERDIKRPAAATNTPPASAEPAAPAKDGNADNPGAGNAKTAEFQPRDGWRTSLLKAREYAKALGISTKDKSLLALVEQIDANLADTIDNIDSARIAANLQNPEYVAGVMGNVYSAIEAATGMDLTPAAEAPAQNPIQALNEKTAAKKLTPKQKQAAAEEAVRKAIAMSGKQPAAKDVQSAMAGAVSTDHLSNDQVDQIAAMFDKPKAPADKIEALKAQADLMAGLADLADIFGKNVKANITPEQEQKLVPVLSKVMDAAFRLGYYKFKDAARFVINTIRDKIGTEVADQITLDHLQGAYIIMAGQKPGVSSKKEVISYDSLDALIGPSNTGIDAGAAKVGSDRFMANAKFLSDLNAVHPGLEKSLGTLNAESRRVVVQSVFGVLHDRQVLDSIIPLVPVDVVNDLTGEKGSAELLLNNEPMLINELAVAGPHSVMVRSFDRLLSAFGGAKNATSDVGGKSFDSGSATIAGSGIGGPGVKDASASLPAEAGGPTAGLGGVGQQGAATNFASGRHSPSIILDGRELQEKQHEGNQSATTGARSDSPLASASAEDVPSTEGGRDAGTGSDDGGAKDAGRAGDTGKPGSADRKRVGNGKGKLPVSTGGSGSVTGSTSDGGISGSAGSTESDQQSAARTVEAGDYRITDLTRLGEGGQRTKFNNNVEAIRLMRELQASGRKATPDEQNTLARYVGWGGIPQAFDANNGDWTKQHAELKELLTPEEWDAAVESTQYAHYTSQGVIDGIYQALQHLGFSGGRVLEPGSGVGNFIGLMPDAIRSQSRFTGVERERIAGGIAKLLYPNQNVQQQDFTYFNADDGYFDAAIGNPPFSETKLTDMTGRKHLSGLSIHNYFFAKSVDMLRENGVLAMVVTSSFMDAKRDRARSYIAEHATLLGAIRLPNSAFMGNANTDVTTDIIFLKKRPEAEWGSKAAKEDGKRWLDLSSVPDPRGGDDIAINKYFVDNPGMMLGTMERTGGRYSAEMPGLVAPKGVDIGQAMAEAVKNLPANVYESSSVSKTKQLEKSAAEAMQDVDVQVGGYFVRAGQLYQRANDIAGEQMGVKITPETQWTEKTQLGQGKYDKLVAASNLRNTLRQLISAESKNDSVMDTLRQELNGQYDAFVKKHGYFHDRATGTLLGDDPDFPLLLSLEGSYDPGITDGAAKKQGIKAIKPSAKKSPIFTRSVLDARAPVTHADSPVDALMVSIAERGRIDPQFIGQLLKRDGAAVLDELTKGEKPELFVDPAGGGYVLRDEYLSGNVRKKLAQAQAAGMDGNARALLDVIPEDVPSHEIQGKLGAPWIPTATYEAFGRHLLGDDAKVAVSYVAELNTFAMTAAGVSDVANANTHGIPDYTAAQIMSALMNNKQIKVGHYDDEGKFHLNKDKTDEALEKAMAMREKFGDWLMADADRAEQMVREYNDKMNNYVVRKFDGAILKFPGKVSDLIIKFRRHQRNAIARIIQDGRGLLDHFVGAGKTFTVIGAAMELKRTGLAKKSMIAVPNHLVKQWAADFYKLYPGANILTATKKDFEKSNRRKFLAKIATGDWDAVIMAHSSFGFIKPAAEFEATFNAERIKEIVEAIEQMGPQKGADSQTKRTVKQLAKMKEKLEQRIKSLRDKPMDSLLDFSQLGIDQLFVDEFHFFKNLMYTTKMQGVRGLGQPEGSQRAYDMFIKIRQITQANGGKRGFVGATGTPISNSLAEMYHMLRYLAPETLEDMKHKTFDAWANTFAEVEQVWMQAMTGEGYKSTNRMTKFVNTPDLLKVYDQVADTVTLADLKEAYREENDGKEFPIPRTKGGRRQPVSLIRTAAQTAYMEQIAQRAKALEQRKGKPEKGEDNMLSILGDARKAAMDIRMVDPTIMQREPDGRIAIVAQNVFDTYQKFDHVRGAQLVFSDMGTPKKTAAKELAEYQTLMAAAAPLKDEDLIASADLGDEDAISALEDAEKAQADIDSRGRDWQDAIQMAMRGFSLYDDLRDALIEKGMPEQQIAFIHDYNTDEQKAALFRAVNDGKIRVLIGSTQKMGAGTNVQERLVELHHMDVPWKPSDIEQREGRIERQGNLLLNEIGPDFEVSIKAYATQDTLDLFMWQTQEKKLSMINQLRIGNVGREMDDAFEELQMSAGEMQAAATSNPYLLEEIQLKDKVKKLERQKKSFEGQQNDLITRKKRSEQAVKELPAQIKQAEAIDAQAQKYYDELKSRTVSMTINGETFTDETLAGDKLRELTGEDDDEDNKTLIQTVLDEAAGKPKRKKMEPLDINGVSYKSKTAVAEAFRKIVGDGAKISFVREGQTYIRRVDIRAAIQKEVLRAAETDDTIMIGKMGPFDISVTGNHNTKGEVNLVVTATAAGKDVPGSASTSSYKDMLSVAESGILEAIRAAERVIDRSSQNLPWLRADLAKAEKTLADLAKVDMNKAWDGGKDLEAARQRHRDVLKQINAAGTTEASEAQEPVAPEAPDFMRKATETPEFKKWFGDSKVVGADGKPLVVYHGTNKQFDTFNTGAGPRSTMVGDWDGVHFTNDKEQAQSIANSLARSEGGTPRVVEAYLHAANPAPYGKYRTKEQAETAGHDSRLTENNTGLQEWTVFNPEQIKSATGNNGDFDPANSDIRFMRKTFNPVMESVATRVADMMTTQKQFNPWHRTVGTQYHKAQQHAGFKKVFDGVQMFLRDTTQIALQAEAMAPDILPKLDTMRGLLADVKRIGANSLADKAINMDSMKAADREQLAAMIYNGTLEKERFTDDELRQRFKATPQQIRHYHQYLASINDSLDSLAKSEMVRLAKLAGITNAERLMDGSVHRAARVIEHSLNDGVRDKLMEYLETIGKNNFYPDARFMEWAEQEKSALAIADKFAKDYSPLTQQVEKVQQRVKLLRAAFEIDKRNDQLQEQGYVPLMRFGRYFIHMTDQTSGETTFFSLFESETEANRVARDLRELNPDMDLAQGITSSEQFKLMKGVSPESMALFADAAGVERDDMMQQYFKLATNNNSTLKRLIKRKGTDGYSEDVTRALASFITSNARRASSNINQGDIDKAAEAIKEGDVKDEAIRLKEYVQNPLEEAAALRGLMFAWFLGGSVASALVNITQPFMMTYPRLSTFGSAKAAKELASASMLAAKAATGAKLNLTGKIGAALAKAQDDGIVAPQEIFQLMATAGGAGAGSKAVAHLSKLWGSFFSMAESFNRYSTFIAAFNLADDAGIADPYEYAVNTVYDTQGLYNKGNRPNWGRGAVGATLLTFKQFSISYLEFLVRLPKKQKLMALALLMLAAGSDGLPFEDDLEDLIDALAEKMGYAWNTKAEKRAFLQDMVGEAGTNFVTRGISAFLPFDVSGRMGSGNLIPGTGMLSPAKQDKLQEASEAVGAVGGLAKAGMSAYRGEFAGALPVAISNLYKGIRIAATGEIRNTYGKKIADAKPGDALSKMIGLNPNTSAEASRIQGINNATLAMQKAKKRELMANWADAIIEKNGAEIAKARMAVKAWNDKNGDTMPILINPASLSRAVQEKRMTGQQRTAKHAPREMRALLLSAEDDDE